MKKPFSLVFSAVLLTGCVNRGPDQLHACLTDPAFMSRYMASQNINRVMVGGVSPEGETRCYWSEDDKTLSITTTSDAWKMCRAEARACTVLAAGDQIVFDGHEQHLRERSASDPGAAGVAWFLIGQFAQGLAYGLGYGMAAPSPGFPTYAPSAASAAPVEASSPRRSTRCMPIGAAGTGQFPTYVCR